MFRNQAAIINSSMAAVIAMVISIVCVLRFIIASLVVLFL